MLWMVSEVVMKGWDVGGGDGDGDDGDGSVDDVGGGDGGDEWIRCWQ